jgi:hypothetical protein
LRTLQFQALICSYSHWVSVKQTAICEPIGAAVGQNIVRSFLLMTL